MVVMFDRKLKYVAYISGLQSSHLNQEAQIHFCEKKFINSIQISIKDFLYICKFWKFEFFFSCLYTTYVMWWISDTRNRRKIKILIYNFFFSKNSAITTTPARRRFIAHARLLQWYWNDVVYLTNVYV